MASDGLKISAQSVLMTFDQGESPSCDICAAFSKASARERSPTKQYLWRHFLLFSRRTFAGARFAERSTAVTRDHSFSSLIWRTTSFDCLSHHHWETGWGPILPRFPKSKSSDNQCASKAYWLVAFISSCIKYRLAWRSNCKENNNEYCCFH